MGTLESKDAKEKNNSFLMMIFQAANISACNDEKTLENPMVKFALIHSRYIWVTSGFNSVF